MPRENIWSLGDDGSYITEYCQNFIKLMPMAILL